MHVAQRFERFLDTYRRPDGGRWGGAELAKATGGAVPRSYVTNLRKGRKGSPGYEKMRAVAKAMGFPPEAWFDETPGGGALTVTAEGRDLAARAEHLFETIVHPKTGESYTSAEVARLSAGDLTEDEVEGIRTGAIPDPTVGQVAALAAVFGMPPSYLVDRGKGQTVLDDEVMDALPEREKGLVLGIVRQLGKTL